MAGTTEKRAENQGHEIRTVADDSIAGELGLKPGDRVLSFDNKPIIDVFDFHFRQLTQSLLLTVLTAEGELIEFDIEKDADEGLGLSFEDDLLGDCRTCHNHCLFCFVDQLPKGMRSTLYVKDDDLRMSFLHGNYVTLTNMSEQELERLIEYRFSPVNISVHTTDADLRRKMMGNKKAGEIMTRLKKIARAGLMINAQIVLCPGLNDQAALDKTLSDLTALGPALGSVAVVPVGLTKFRAQNKLYPLRPVDEHAARYALDQIHTWQKKMLVETGSRKIFAADELYLKAGMSLPPYDAYEDFPQLENGIGMTIRTLTRIRRDLNHINITEQKRISDNHEKTGHSRDETSRHIVLVTGTAFAPLLSDIVKEINDQLEVSVSVLAVENSFFGHSISVSGLLTGRDIISSVKAHLTKKHFSSDHLISLILPSDLLRAATDVLLDDMTISDLSRQLNVSVEICAADGSDLLETIGRIYGRKWFVSKRNRPSASATKGASDHE